MTVMTSALRTVGLAAPGAHRKPSGRYRAPGPATTVWNIPLPTMRRRDRQLAGSVWWLNLQLPIPKLRDLLRPLVRSRRAGVALGAIILAMWLVACGGPTHGTVTRKSFTPAHTDYQLHCAAYNAKMTCIAWINQPYSYPDSWELYITDHPPWPCRDRTCGCRVDPDKA